MNACADLLARKPQPKKNGGRLEAARRIYD